MSPQEMPRAESRAAAFDLTLKPMKLDSPVIATGRLLLRPPHEADAEDIARLANNAAVAKMLYSMPHPYTERDAREFLDRQRASEKGGCVYAVTLASTGEFMGICGLHEDRERYSLPFIGYWLGEPYWGKGYATEAARGMVDLFFKVTAGDMLMISCRTDNTASLRVIEKCGGRYWTTDEQFNKALDERQMVHHFRVSRADWMATAAE